MQPEKPESQVELQLFASRLNVPLLPWGIPGEVRLVAAAAAAAVVDELMAASALACANHSFLVGISLWGIVTWEFRWLALRCYLLGSLGRTIARKLLGNCPAAAAAGTVSRDCSSLFNDAQHMPIEMAANKGASPALACKACNPSLRSAMHAFNQHSGMRRHGVANYPKHKSIVLGHSTSVRIACDMPFALL